MFDDVLKSFKTKIQNKMDTLTCLSDKAYVEVITEETEGGVTYTTTTYSLSGSNSAYNTLSSWASSLIDETFYPPYDVIPKIVIPSSFIGKPSNPSLNLHMYYTIMSLFIQLEAEPLSGEAAQKSIEYKRDSENFINQSAECINQSESKKASAESKKKSAESKRKSADSKRTSAESKRAEAKSKRAEANKSNTEAQANALNKEADKLDKDADTLDKEANTLDKEADKLDRESISLISEANVLTTKSEMCKSNAQLYEEKSKDYEEKAGFTERAEDVNYNLINAYADGTKSFEDYNSSTEEFFKRAEYWNIRGHLYELLPNANDGTFLKRNERLVDDLCSFLDGEEAKYILASYKTDAYSPNDENGESSSTRPYSKAEKYWGKHIEDDRNRQQDLEWKIDKTLEVIRKDVQDFYSTLIKFVYDYLRLYEEASKYISSGETFISALQKTSANKDKTLSECYERINVGGFQRYSSDLSKAYEYFVRACERRDASKYKNVDDNNLYLRKFYQYEVLTDYNFFSRAEQLLEQIKVLRERLDI